MRASPVLRHLDAPWKLGLWELDVAGAFVFFMCLGLMKGTMAAFFGFAVLGAWVCSWISRLKAMRHPGYFLHLMFWWLPSEMVFLPRGIIPRSDLRALVG